MDKVKVIADQSDEEVVEVRERDAIYNMVNSLGWKIIEPLIRDKIESIELKRGQSDDPNVIMSCVRQEDGLKFIFELVDSFLSTNNI